MSKFTAAIIGLTGIGSNRPDPGPLGIMPRSHASAYHNHPETDVVAVCDLRPAALEEFKKTWSDVWPNLKYYDDHARMINDLKPDILSVVTPDDAHAQIVVDAAKSSIRAILCEKPIATTLADADLMASACSANGTLLSIEHTRRWDPSYRKARDLIQSGELGSLRTIVGELFSPRAMLFRNGIHLIDMFTFFAQTEAKWVVGELEPGFSDYSEYKGDGGRSPQSDPYASAYIRYEDDIRGFMNLYKMEFPGWQIQLTCEKGRIMISDRNLSVIKATSQAEWQESNVQVETHMYTHQLGAVSELVSAITDGTPLICPPSEARKAVEIVLAILKSHTEGNRRINLPLDV